MGVQPDVACSFCSREKDSLRHMFWECRVVIKFWNELETFIKQNCWQSASNLVLNQNIILFGHAKNVKFDKTFDYILLSAKFFYIQN